jgi:hypothetical protein
MLNYTRTFNSTTDIRNFLPEAAIRDKTLLDQHCKFPVAPLAIQSDVKAKKDRNTAVLVIYSICTRTILVFIVPRILSRRPILFTAYLM